MNSFELKWVPSMSGSISKLPPLIQSNVLRALHDGALEMQRISQEKYLTGPRPDKLAIKTGLLRSRVLGIMSGTGGDPSVFGSITLGVSGIKYARIHELGGIIHHPGSQARNFPYMVFFWKKRGFWARFKKTGPHDIPIPQRAYLQPAFEESLPRVKMLIQLAVDKAYRDS